MPSSEYLDSREMNQRIGRRSFFGHASALASLAGGIEALHAAGKPGARPQSIIWMVADGMSPSVLPLAEQFSRRVRAGKGLVWQELLNHPKIYRAMMDMASLDSMVTDSSSASSSWGSGSRVFNGWINVLPDGTKLIPLAQIARDKRKRVGLVTTATATHATPAGFAAVSRRRDDEALIAEQYLTVADVVLGGGRKYFDAAARADKRDLIAEYRNAGFGYAASRDQLAKLSSAKLLGLFSASHLPYTLDQRNSETEQELVPTLAEMAEAALKALDGGPNGFLLQIEAARVDHAAHANDAASLLWDQLAFDEAIEVALRYAERRPETLIVIASDHGNANPGLNGMGTEYRDSTKCFDRLAAVKSSFYAISPRLGASVEYTMKVDPDIPLGPKPSVERVREHTRTRLGIELTADEVEILRSAASGQRRLCASKQLDALPGLMGQVVGNHIGIGWIGSTHTSDYTLVTALGPGAERFSGFIRNTQVFPALTELMDVQFRNPSMDPATAKQYKAEAALQRRERPDWA